MGGGGLPQVFDIKPLQKTHSFKAVANLKIMVNISCTVHAFMYNINGARGLKMFNTIYNGKGNVSSVLSDFWLNNNNNTQYI